MPKPKRFITCPSCRKKKVLHKANGLCSACYQRTKPKKKHIPLLKFCAGCNETKPYHGAGLCKNCHALKSAEIRRAQIVTCTRCEQAKPKYAKGLCMACYEYDRYELRHAPRRIQPTCCAHCGTAAERYLRGLCPKCYDARRNRSNSPYVLCFGCSELRVHVAHGLCRPCYVKQYDDPPRPPITCDRCGAERQPHGGWGLCRPCYNVENRSVRNRWRRRRYLTDPAFRLRMIYEARKHKLLKRACEQQHTPEEWTALLELFDFKCAYCNTDIKVYPTKDHVVPLSQGGTDDIENITPACGSCNSKKGTRSAVEFIWALHQARESGD